MEHNNLQMIVIKSTFSNFDLTLIFFYNFKAIKNLDKLTESFN